MIILGFEFGDMAFEGIVGGLQVGQGREEV
jgi:hypothetical protein